MFTYLQHSDPTVPYYREVRITRPVLLVSPNLVLTRSQKSWTFVRGALATVDRPVFGWIGEFFWHGVSSALRTMFRLFGCLIFDGYSQINHHHVAHHFFVTVPFCEHSFARSSLLSH